MTGKQLRAMREAAGMRQQDLGAALGVHWTTVSRMERGEWEITKAMAIAAGCILRHKRKPSRKKRV